jgi:hypothetical protein
VRSSESTSTSITKPYDATAVPIAGGAPARALAGFMGTRRARASHALWQPNQLAREYGFPMGPGCGKIPAPRWLNQLRRSWKLRGEDAVQQTDSGFHPPILHRCTTGQRPARPRIAHACGWPQAQERPATVLSFLRVGPFGSMDAPRSHFGGRSPWGRQADAPRDFPAADFPQRMRR